MIMKDVPRIWL